MNVLTFALGITAARFLVRAGWPRDHINSVLRGDNFISKSAFQDIQKEAEQFDILRAKFTAPDVISPLSWKTSAIEIEDATPESAASVLRKGGWKPDDIQSVLKAGDKHSSEIDWLYLGDETENAQEDRSSSSQGGIGLGGIIFIVISLIFLLSLL